MRRLHVFSIPLLLLMLVAFTAKGAERGTINDATSVSTDTPAPGTFASSRFTAMELSLSAAAPSPMPTCYECKDGIRYMRMRYNGSWRTWVRVYDKEETYFSGWVEPGGYFEFDNGGDKFEKNDLTVESGGSSYEMKVDCNDSSMAPGHSFGNFTIMSATSKDGPMCNPYGGGDDPYGGGGPCQECDGGVTSLTLRYEGTIAASVVVLAGSDKTYNVGTVQPGQEFTLTGTKSDGKFEKNSLEVFVDGSKQTEIHVSCSQPIAPGLSFGSFLVTAATSRSGGDICPVNPPGGGDPGCSECDGGVTSLTLRYDGAVAAYIEVRAGDDHTYKIGLVQPGAEFTVTGTKSDGKFEKNNLELYVNGSLSGEAHVSCSKPIAPGLSFGAFTVTAAVSKDGGNICPTNTPPGGGCSECDGGFTSLTLRYTGSTEANIVVRAGSDKSYSIGLVQPGAEFTVTGTKSDGKFEKNNLEFYVNGSLNTEIHVSCSQTVEKGMNFGSFTVIDGTSRDGGPLCPIIPPPPPPPPPSPDHFCASDRIGQTYGFWLPELVAGKKFYTIWEAGIEENDHSAVMTGRIQNDMGDGFEIYIDLGGRTNVAPYGSPKQGDSYTVDSSSYVYYTSVEGTLTGLPGTAFEGAVVTFDRRGPAFQLGIGANGFDQHALGASTWFAWHVTQQPSTGTYLKQYGDGDINVTLEANCWPQPKEIDLALVKEAIGYNSDTGEATYSVTIYNQSTVTATGVEMADLLPGDAQFAGFDSKTAGTGAVSATAPNRFVWDVGTIPGGTVDTQDEFTGPSVEIVFRALIGPSLSTANIAEVSKADQVDRDSTPGNRFSGAGRLMGGGSGLFAAGVEDDDDDADLPIVDLNLQKKILSFDPTTMLAEYELTVMNNSQVTATDVQVRDYLPLDAQTEIGSRIDIVPATSGFFWNVGSVAPGSSETTSVFVKIGQSQDTMNCAEISSMGEDGMMRALIDADSTPGNFDPDAGASEDDEACVDKMLIDLSLEKEVASFDPDTQQVTYLVTVRNQGSNVATGVVVREHLPQSSVFVAGSAVASIGTFNGMDWTIGDLPINGFATLALDVKIEGDDTRNCAEVHDANEMDFDSDPGNFVRSNGAVEDDEACADKPLIDIRLEKTTIEPSTVDAGGTATFKITVTNDGPEDAVGVKVKDLLPAGLSVNAATSTAFGFDDGTVSWFVGDLPAGVSRDLILKVNADEPGEYRNCAEVVQSAPMDRDSTPDNFDTDPSEDDEDCSYLWVRESKIDLYLTKAAVETQAKVGETVTFKVRVKNQSDVEATNVVIADYLGQGLEYAGSRPSSGGSATWVIPSLGPGAEMLIEIDAKVTEAGELTNCAEVFAADQDDVDSEPGNFNQSTRQPAQDDEACASIWTTNPKTDLKLTKTVDRNQVLAGESVTYTITVENESAVDATDVQVEDAIPSGLWPLSATFSQGNFAAPVWNVGTLAAGASATLDLQVRVDVSGEIKNCAQVKHALPEDRDSTPGNFGGAVAEDDEACVTIWAGQPKIDLDLKKTVSETNVKVDDIVTWTLTLKNEGNADATSVQVAEYLPTSLAPTGVRPSQGSLSGTTWLVGTLAKGATATLELDTRVKIAGEIKNCAEVWDADQTDRDSQPANFSGSPAQDDEACTTIWSNDQKIDLELEKTVDRTNVKKGESVQYMITVTNKGPGEAQYVSVKDALPAGLWITNATPSQGGFSGDTWSVGTIAKNGAAVLLLDVLVDADGEFTNCAEVASASPADKDSTPGNFSTAPSEDDGSCVTIWSSIPKTDLKLTKTVDVATATVGDIVTFTITVENESYVAANGVVVRDVLPSSLWLKSFVASPGDYSGSTWNIGYLAGGQSATLVLKTRVDAAGGVKNCAEIWDASPDDVDSTPGNYATGAIEDDNDCAIVSVDQPTIDLRLEKSVSQTTVAVGSTVTYTLKVSNDGHAKATGIQVADYLPTGLEFAGYGARPSQGYLSGLTWHVGEVDAYGFASLDFDVTVKASGEFTNCAEIWDADQQDDDSTPGNFDRTKAPKEDDEACVSIWSNDPRIDISLEKTVNEDNVLVGDVVRYAIVVSNDGPADASGVKVTDQLPNGLWLQSWSADEGQYVGDVWNIGYLAAGRSARLEIDALVDRKGEFENCAEVRDASPLDKDSTPGNFNKGWGPREDDESCVSIWAREQTGTNEITGFVYVDKNENLVFDSGDIGQGGVTVQLWRDLNGNTEVDGYDEYVEDVVTAYDGSYGFWVGEKGQFAIQVDASTLPDNANLLGDNSEDAQFYSFGQTDSGNNFPIVFMQPQPSAMCYLVADNDGNGANSPDVLTKLATDASYEQVIGATYTDHIESIAFNPWTGTLYAADDRRLGTLDINTGAFYEIGEFGGGEGAAGWRPFLDVDGLAFDPLSGELFASVRKVGEPDFIIKVNPATGSFIPFGYGLDYLVISSPYGLEDIDDIAIDPIDGSMWAINNTDGEFSRLVKIDRTNGVITDVKPLPIANVEGLGFFGDGTMYGTGGEGLESIVIIDKATLTVDILLTIGTAGNRDYEAVDCLTAQPNSLSVTIFNDEDYNGQQFSNEIGVAGINVELFRDVNHNGQADFADRLVATRRTGGNGTAYFATAANGAFVTRIGNSALPLGATTTTKASSAEWFNGFGEERGTTMIGVNMPEGSLVSTSNEAAPEYAEVPASFALKAAYPNPFNPVTTVPFDLNETTQVRMAVYDVLGRQVATLVDGQMAAGSHQARIDGSRLASGTYLVRLTAGTQIATRTITLIK